MINFKNILAVTASILAMAGAVEANPAYATNDLNVRSGPGTQFAILDQLFRGEQVEVVECVNSGWCRVQFNGPMGWVSRRYLGGTQNQAGNQGGNGQPQGGQNGAVQACFFTQPNHSGQSFCINEGTVPQLPYPFENNISSYRVTGGAHVRFCTDHNMSGACYEGHRSTPTLGYALDNQATSLRVFSVGGGFNQGNQQGNNQGNNQGQANNNQQPRDPNDPNCSTSFVINSDGEAAFAINCGDNPQQPQLGGNNNQGGGNNQVPLPPAEVREDGACFYMHANYQGASYCSGIDHIQRIPAPTFGQISSIKVIGNAKVRICSQTSFRGNCNDYTRSISLLPRGVNDTAKSTRIVVGNLPVNDGGNHNNNAGNNHGNAGNGHLPRPQPLAETPPAEGLCLYNGTGYKGFKRCIPGVRNRLIVNLPAGSYPKSIMVARGTVARVCSRPQLTGKCLNITGKRSPLPLIFRNGVRSVKFISGNSIPQFHSGGDMGLSNGQSLDMDRHKRYIRNTGSNATEISVSAIPGGTFTLKFNNGVVSKNMGTGQQGYATCSLANLRVTGGFQHRLSILPANTTFCIRTKGGRIATVRYMGTRNNQAQFRTAVWKLR